MNMQQNSEEKNTQSPPEILEAESKKSKKWIIAIILILLCIGLFFLVFLSGCEDDTADEIEVVKVEEEVESVVEVEEEVEDVSDMTGEWVQVYTDEGMGSKNTKVFQIERDNTNGWKVIYTFKGSTDESKFYIEKMTPPLHYGSDIVKGVIEDGEVIFDDGEGPHYLKIGTDDDSLWTVEIQQLLKPEDERIIKTLDDSSGEWVSIYEDEGVGSKNTEEFEIQEEGNKGWEINYTFEGSSDTETLYIEKMTPPLKYGTAIAEYVYDDGKYVYDDDSDGTFFLRVGTNDESAWTVKIRQLLE
ncbi:MAG: hypothetical protein U9Q12_00165 [Patescibacteria group bacterium]|nr:hypothetical protein [Patescibacteria group bacterium]